MEYSRRKEVEEAVRAGEKALQCLYKARADLKSAGNWGLVDIFGGSFISGMLKHSKIDDAKHSMRQAQKALNIFRKELDDVRDPGLRLGIDGFITFADFFFDNILVDVLVQNKIRNAQDQVEDAIRQVEDMLRELRYYR